MAAQIQGLVDDAVLIFWSWFWPGLGNETDLFAWWKQRRKFIPAGSAGRLKGFRHQELGVLLGCFAEFGGHSFQHVLNAKLQLLEHPLLLLQRYYCTCSSLQLVTLCKNIKSQGGMTLVVGTT